MGETLYKVKIKATFKINLNVAFNMSECYKKDTFIHSGNKMSSFESLTGNHTPSSAIRIPNCNCSIFSISSFVICSNEHPLIAIGIIAPNASLG